MNSLSWLIYLAEVSGSIGSALGVVCFLSSVAFIASIIVQVRHIGPPDTVWSWESRPEKVESRAKVHDAAFGVVKMSAAVFLAAALVGSFVPSSKTLYAIAASEVGEDVLKSKTADKAMKALDSWLDKQIREEKGRPNG